MSSSRLWIACLVLPGALVLDATALAAPSRGPSADELLAQHHGRLPKGVRKKAGGHYTTSVCDESQPLHCMLQRVLPSDYVPWQSALIPAGDLDAVPLAGATTTPPTGMGPKEIAAAYNLSTLPPATGQIVALIDSPDSFAVSDLAGYRAGYGLPALPTCPTGTNGGLPVPGGTPCFAAVDVNGALHTATTAENNTNGDLETALDMDMVSAACPACSILLVQLTGAQQDILGAVASARKLGAAAISISLGGPESTDPVVGQGGGAKDPTGYSTPGHLVFVASGDFGYLNETLCTATGQCSGTPTTPSYPASAPDVIAVGGTQLQQSGASYTEVVWNNGVTTGAQAQDITTSGCSSEFAQPAWQASNAQVGTTSCKKRATADIAGAASFKASSDTTQPSDIVIYSTASASQFNGFTAGIEGTSASSPLLAAIFVRAGLIDAVSNNLGWPYANPSAFNDVTQGNDDPTKACAAADKALCNAGPGWDGPTGMGTPNGPKLLAAAGGSSTPVDAGYDSGAATSVDAGTDATVPPPPHGTDAGPGPVAVDAGPAPGMDSGVNGSNPNGPHPAPSPGASTTQQGCGIGAGKSAPSSGLIAGIALGLTALLSRRRRQRI